MLALGVLLAALWAPHAEAAPASHPLQTAIVDPTVFTGRDAGRGLDRAVAAGATAIKVPLFWNTVAPARRPPGFRASDPSEPAYGWAGLDAQLRLIRARGLEPLVYIAAAPAWAVRAIDGARRPDPAQYRAFALAAARRYSGTRPGLPRVRYWQAWNEPNKVAGPSAKPGVEAWYRTLVNEFAASVHSVPGDLVIAGGVSPFGISTAVAPLAFMRDLLCVSAGTVPRATCSSTVHFDVWSVDPYTAGGPFHRTARPDDVSVAELPTMRRVLGAAERMGHVSSVAGHARFWVTEFAWDSNPPDPAGVPLALEGRWVAEALHQMWQAGVTLVTWYTLRDQPLRTSAYQSGLYLMGPTVAADRPKPAFTAFRFPFVAYPDREGRLGLGSYPASHLGPGRDRAAREVRVARGREPPPRSIRDLLCRDPPEGPRSAARTARRREGRVAPVLAHRAAGPGLPAVRRRTLGVGRLDADDGGGEPIRRDRAVGERGLVGRLPARRVEDRRLRGAHPRHDACIRSRRVEATSSGGRHERRAARGPPMTSWWSRETR